MPTLKDKLIATGPRNLAILFLGGFNLILIQFFIIREINAILRGTEVVYLITTLAYFAGYSVGYGMSGRLSRRWVVIWAWITWGLHLTLPFSIRYVSGFVWDVAPDTSGLGPGLAFVLLLFVLAFGLSAFYSLLLPHMIDQDGGKNLVPYYQVELIGAVCSIGVLVVSGRFPLAVPLAYQIDLALLLCLLVGRVAPVPLAALGVVVYALAFRGLDHHSLAYGYDKMHNRTDSKMVFSVNSPYQKVDIVEAPDGDRTLYLDGLRYFGGSRLSGHNRFLADLPARLDRAEDVLIVGSGSMQSVGLVAASRADRVHTCELDPAVIEGSRRWFGEVNRLDEIENWTYSIDDIKHFLGSDERMWDLIIMDVPAPLAIQTGLLHSVDFYELARSKLKPGGIISVALSGRLHDNNPTPCTVAHSLLTVFPEAWVVTPGTVGRSFAYAGDDLTFDDAGIRVMLKTMGEKRYTIMGHEEALQTARHYPPLTQTNLRYVMRRSWRRVKNRFVPDFGDD